MEERAMVEEKAFYSEGIRLLSRMSIPENYSRGEKLPGIVVCFGYSGDTRFHTRMLEIFSQAGFVALTFDYRGFGGSDGPQGRFIPTEQVRDIRNALTFLGTFPEVDEDRIGLYGRSWGGANVVYTAAVDKRVKCVVSTSGIGNGERWLRSLRRAWEWAEFLKKIEEDRIKSVLTGISELVTLDDIIFHTPSYKKVLAKRFKKSGYKLHLRPLDTVDATLEFRPEDVVHKIAPRPLLLIHGASDTIVPPEESQSMYEKAGEPKKLVMFPGADHQDFYLMVNSELFHEVLSLAIDWFDEYLKKEWIPKEASHF